MRPFSKPAITVPEQILLLKARGLCIHDEHRAGCFLQSVSFFRLTPYMRPWQTREDPNHHFQPGANLRQITRLYDFDRRLRLLVMDAIERTEVAIRAQVSNYMGPIYGAHWYVQRERFKDCFDHARLLDTITKIQQKALQDYQREAARIDRLANAEFARKRALKQRREQESYARHYVLAYNDPDLMPGWAMLEELTLGELSHLYSGLAKDADRKAVAQGLCVPAPLLASWLHTLTVVRNICAHHARLWNRELGIRPEQPRRAGFKWPTYLHNNVPLTRVAVVLAILHHLMQQTSPHARWHSRLADLLASFPNVPRHSMGLPDNWEADAFWNGRP